MMRRSRLALWLTAFALVNTASADDLSGVAIERDKLEQVEGACRAVLVIENGIGADFEALALDLVVFDADGVIAERLAVDLAPLAAGKASVKAFDIAGLDCADAGRFLMNGVLGCRSLGDAPIVAAILDRVSEDGVLAGICGKPRKLTVLAIFAPQVSMRLSQPARIVKMSLSAILRTGASSSVRIATPSATSWPSTLATATGFNILERRTQREKSYRELRLGQVTPPPDQAEPGSG